MFAYALASNPCSEATFLMLEALSELSLENFRLNAFCVLLFNKLSFVNYTVLPQ